MQRNNNETMDDADDGKLTIQKKPRSEAQLQATERMRAALKAKHDAKPAVSKLSKLEEKKIMLKALKDKLNNAPPADDATDEEEPDPIPQPKPAKKQVKQEVIEDDEMSEEEPIKPAKVAAKAPAKVPAKMPTSAKQKKIVYNEPEDDEESDGEVIVIKKQKKKKPKKTIIIEESESEDEYEEPPTPMPRPTKSQQNRLTKNITAPQQPATRYYFDS